MAAAGGSAYVPRVPSFPANNNVAQHRLRKEAGSALCASLLKQIKAQKTPAVTQNSVFSLFTMHDDKI